MSDLKFETLISSNQYPTSERWYPKPVDQYKASINIIGNDDEAKRLRSNFAYSMQYIEYIEKQIDELKLSDVMLTMLYKSYIITSMSIIEALLVNLLHRTNNWNTMEWQEISKIISNPKMIDGTITKVETHLFKKVTAFEMRMDLDSMIKRVEKKNLLTIDHGAFPAMKKLRELRNRVHIQLGDGPYDHDYNCFGFDTMQMMRRILFTILTTQEFCRSKETFDFIKDSYVKRGGTFS